MADSCLCKLSLQLIFATLSSSTMFMLSFLDLAEEDCFGHAYVFQPCDLASPVQLEDGLYAEARSKMDSITGRLAVLRTYSFDMWSCHLMPGWSASSVGETAPVA